MTSVGVEAVVSAVLHPAVYQATKYLSPTHIVKATRRRFNGKLLNGNARQETLLVTMGRPNYRERQFVQGCQRAHEPFPIRKMQIRRVA